VGSCGRGVTRGHRGLERVPPVGAVLLLGPTRCGEAVLDERPVPPCSVLIQKQDGLACRADARRKTGRMQLHEGEQSVGLRLGWRDGGEDSPSRSASSHSSGRDHSAPDVAV
jgi:hypothetical protein